MPELLKKCFAVMSVIISDNKNEYSVSLCLTEGPVTPQGTGFLAVQSVTGTNVSQFITVVTAVKISGNSWFNSKVRTLPVSHSNSKS